MAWIDGFSMLIFNVYEAFTVAIFAKEAEHLICLSSMTFSSSFDKDRRMPVEGTLPGWVVKHNQPLIIPNFDREEAALGYYGTTEGIKSFMGYPMEDKGVIVVDSKKKWVFTDKEKKVLTLFASMIKEEIEREKRFQAIEERLEASRIRGVFLDLFNGLNLSTVNTTDIFKECIHISGADIGFVTIERDNKCFIYDILGIEGHRYLKKECPSVLSIASLVTEGGRELLLPYDSSLLKERPMFFRGEGLKARQFFGFPLFADDTVIGAIGFISISERQLNEQSIGILRDVSTMLSLFYSSKWTKANIENFRHFDSLTGSLQFTAFLDIIDKKIRRKEGFSLLSVKIPNIGLCNSTMGLSFTNRLIKRVFNIITNCAGPRATISRKGASHFYLLLKGGSSSDADSLIRVLKHSINRIFQEERVSEMISTIHIFTTSWPEDGPDLWTILNKIKEEDTRKI
jgi:GGDEF domain-containing protein